MHLNFATALAVAVAFAALCDYAQSTTDKPTTEDPFEGYASLKVEGNVHITAMVGPSGDFHVEQAETGERAGLLQTSSTAKMNRDNIAGLTTRMTDAEQRLGVLDSYDIDSRVQSLETANLDSRLGALESSVPDSLDDLDQRVGTNAQGLASTTAKANKNEEDIASEKQDRIDALNDATDRIEAKEGDIQQNGQEIVSIKTRMGQAEAALSTHEDDIEDLQGDATLLKNIVGAETLLGSSKGNPAPTCAHLANMPNADKLYTTGDYWIDPDGGSTENAFQATCDMSSGETKVGVSKTIPFKSHRSGPDERNWYLSLPGAQAIEYDGDLNQMKALSLASFEISQTFQFICRGVLIWGSGGTTYTSTHGARFRSIFGEGYEWGGGSSVPFKPTVSNDRCAANNHGATLSTDFAFKTNNPRLLPIYDINVHDEGGSDEAWSIKFQTLSFKLSLGDGKSKLTAGRTCSHILAKYPTSPSGTYWLDPNGGSPDDAVELECDMTAGGWTIVAPPDGIEKKNYRTGSDTRSWVTSFLSNKLDAKLAQAQLEALQDASSRAKSSLMFDCKGVLAYRYHVRSTQSRYDAGSALWFRSSRNVLWFPEESQDEADGDYVGIPIVRHDDCMENDDVWRDTEFMFLTENARALPIDDISVNDHGGSEEHFGVQFRPTQFKTDFDMPVGRAPDTAAKTCADILYASYGNAPDGRYWIDPNGGIRDDAFLAKCDMANGGWTGIEPRDHVPYSNHYTGSDGRRWWSSLGPKRHIRYRIPSDSQLTALQDNAVYAKQTVTFSCRGVIVWYNSNKGLGGDTVEFLGGLSSDGKKWAKDSIGYLRPSVQFGLDDCYRNEDHYVGHAYIDLETGYPKGLPVYDIGMYDIGGSTEQWGADIGIAWFR